MRQQMGMLKVISQDYALECSRMFGMIFLLAPYDYTPASGNFDMTDSNTVQCIPITINITKSTRKCFTYLISTTSSAAGLTLNPTTATICIIKEKDSMGIYFTWYCLFLNGYHSNSSGDHWTSAVLLLYCGGPGTCGSVCYSTVWKYHWQ